MTLTIPKAPTQATHTQLAEHAYGVLRRQSPQSYPLAWSLLPEPIRLAMTLAVITGADHATSRLASSLHRSIDKVVADTAAGGAK